MLLVDDVYTTGATVASATRALKRAGARDVDRAHLRKGCGRHRLKPYAGPLIPASFGDATPWPNVTIYTRQFCGFCARAKQLLDKKDVAYEEKDATVLAGAAPGNARAGNGGATFPQIFIGDTHVGGCDDLYRARPRRQARPAACRLTEPTGTEQHR